MCCVCLEHQQIRKKLRISCFPLTLHTDATIFRVIFFFDGGWWKRERYYHISISVKDQKLSELPLCPLATKLCQFILPAQQSLKVLNLHSVISHPALVPGHFRVAVTSGYGTPSVTCLLASF